MKYVSSKVACARLGVHPNTLRRWANLGRIKTFRTEGGYRRYAVDDFLRGAGDATVVCYCRVSSKMQKDDLERQVSSMQEQFKGAEIVRDIGGGLNYKRKGLIKLLERLHSGEKLQIVVAHKDRLARFGFELIQWMAQQNGGEVMVLDDTSASPKAELTQDILSILDTFSRRLHGLRRYRQAIKEDKSLSSE